MGPTVVIAPDSFKGSLTARLAASALAAGWREARPADELRLFPQADGGEGTLDAIETTSPDARRRSAQVTGPDGRGTTASWLELPGDVAVVELAQSSGLPLMAAPDALGATTFGLGQVIRLALESGARRLVIALGGSASTDGGAGALQALGLRLLRLDGSAVEAGGGGLAELHRIDARDLLPPPPGGVILLTDVSAPLLGPAGSAAVFGPQKGASGADVRRLEGSLARYAALLGGDPAQPGAGAAGGTAYGFIRAWGAVAEPGAAWVANSTGLPAAVAAADTVITGEGRFDSTSVTGKVVGNVVHLAGGARVGVVAGSIAATPEGAWSLSLADLAGSVAAALAEPEKWLRLAGRQAAAHFGPQHP